MEFMPKGTLLQLINKRQKFSKKMFYQIALEIAQALEILERNGMINFDLKSSNILLDKDWHVKLADFEHTFFNEQIPQQIMTTPSCMPPEAFMKEPLTNACVIYSFGWILWEMVTLKNSWAEFWESTGFTDITIANISEHPMTKAIIQGRRAEIPDDCPEKLKKLILACWDGNPTKRPNVKEVVKELSELAKSEEKQQTAHITTAPLPKEEKSKERLPSSSISRIRYTLLPPPVSIPASILQEEIQRVSPVV
jgi:serine/threonine protein kinase